MKHETLSDDGFIVTLTLPFWILLHNNLCVFPSSRKDHGDPSGEQLRRHGTGGHREEGRAERLAGRLLAFSSQHGAAALCQVQHLGAEERSDRSLRTKGSRTVSHSGTHSFIWIRAGTRGRVNRIFSVIDGIFLTMTEKSEGRPSF